MLSLHKLDVFLTVAQEGKICRAAERLFMTQAAVSQHIHDLEAGLGVTLFERSSQGVRLTAAGETLREYAQKILWLAAAAESALTEVRNLKEGRLEIGFTPTAASLLAPHWLKEFHAEYPAIKVNVHTDITPALIQAVLKQQIDLAFVEGETSETSHLQIVEIEETEIFVVVPNTHRWAGRASVSITEIAAEPFLARQGGSQTHSWTMQLFARFGLTPNIVAEFDHPHAILRAVSQGIGISLLPVCFAEEEPVQNKIKLLRLEEIPDLRRTVKAVWRKERPLPPIPRAFLRMLSGRYPQIEQSAFALPAEENRIFA